MAVITDCFNTRLSFEVLKLFLQMFTCTTTTATTTDNNMVVIINIFHMRNNITCSTDCTRKHTTAATLYTLESGSLQVYNCKYPA
jgi:hypothetical protein